jgi:hypothetical protein
LSKIRRTQVSTTTTAAATATNKPRMNMTMKNNTRQNNRLGATNNLFERHASARNRRLALQMANRPSVQAALKLKNVDQTIHCFVTKILKFLSL